MMGDYKAVFGLKCTCKILKRNIVLYAPHPHTAQKPLDLSDDNSQSANIYQELQHNYF